MGAAVLGDQHVVKHRLGSPQPDVLEGPGHAQLSDLIGSGGEDVGILPGMLSLVGGPHLALGVIFHDLLPLEPDGAVGGLVHAGDHVEGSGLSGAVGPDQCHDLSLVDGEVHIVHSHHTAELHGDVFHSQHVLSHWRRLPSPL